VRLVRWLLLRVLPDSAEGHSILGDFLEERARRAPGMRRGAWTLGAAIDLGVHYLPTRLGVAADVFVRDARHALRFLRSHPGYVALASGVLALAIGINLLVFSIVNALWLRPLAIVHPEHVVTILQSGATVKSLDDPRLKVFDGPVAGQVVTSGFNEAFNPRIFFPQVAAPLETLGVTPSYFSVLGVSVRGRAFTEEDERVGAEAVTIISDRLWARAFGRSEEASVL
jgi:MacB-like periplasmic core domain